MYYQFPWVNNQSSPALTELSTLDSIERCRAFQWTYGKWKPTVLLIRKSNGERLSLLKPDELDLVEFELIREEDHDHCDICWSNLAKVANENTFDEGYFSDSGWLCVHCYSHFVEPGDYLKALKKFEIKG